MKPWSWYWALWLVVGFGVPECIALLNKDYGDTLSDTVWSWFGVFRDQAPWHWGVLHFLLAAFMVWLTCHFVFRIWT